MDQPIEDPLELFENTPMLPANSGLTFAKICQNLISLCHRLRMTGVEYARTLQAEDHKLRQCAELGRLTLEHVKQAMHAYAEDASSSLTAKASARSTYFSEVLERFFADCMAVLNRPDPNSVLVASNIQVPTEDLAARMNVVRESRTALANETNTFISHCLNAGVAHLHCSEMPASDSAAPYCCQDMSEICTVLESRLNEGMDIYGRDGDGQVIQFGACLNVQQSNPPSHAFRQTACQFRNSELITRLRTAIQATRNLADNVTARVAFLSQLSEQQADVLRAQSDLQSCFKRIDENLDNFHQSNVEQLTNQLSNYVALASYSEVAHRMIVQLCNRAGSGAPLADSSTSHLGGVIPEIMHHFVTGAHPNVHLLAEIGPRQRTAAASALETTAYLRMPESRERVSREALGLFVVAARQAGAHNDLVAELDARRARIAELELQSAGARPDVQALAQRVSSLEAQCREQLASLTAPPPARAELVDAHAVQAQLDALRRENDSLRQQLLASSGAPAENLAVLNRTIADLRDQLSAQAERLSAVEQNLGETRTKLRQTMQEAAKQRSRADELEQARDQDQLKERLLREALDAAMRHIEVLRRDRAADDDVVQTTTRLHEHIAQLESKVGAERARAEHANASLQAAVTRLEEERSSLQQELCTQVAVIERVAQDIEKLERRLSVKDNELVARSLDATRAVREADALRTQLERADRELCKLNLSLVAMTGERARAKALIATLAPAFVAQGSALPVAMRQDFQQLHLAVGRW